jgi:DNA-binding CsgD family transcriptional regulator
MPPYLPFLEALGNYIRTAPRDQLRIQLGPTTAPLATILPEALLHLEALPPSYPLPAEQMRLRLFEAVGTFLAAIALDAPLILVLDDLQWADAASLDLLSYVAQHQSTIRLMVLGACRASDLERAPALERTLVDLNRARLLMMAPLGSLTQEDIMTLCAHLLGAPADAAIGRLLYEQSEGNPFFAEELLSTWQETGALRLEAQHWTFQGPLPNELPFGIVGVVRQRLARLADETVGVLRTAAILGRTFDLALLAEIVGQGEDLIEGRLLEATGAGLLRASSPDVFTFSHDKVRECLYAEVTPVRRKRLHGFIGRALETRADEENAQQLSSLAFHFARSGDRERGARYSLLAAERAFRASALEDALAYYRRALGLLDPHDPERGAILLRQGETALLAGAEREAVAAYEAAQAWFLQRSDQQAGAQAAHGLGRAWARIEENARARTAFEAALVLHQDTPGAELVATLADLATLLAVSLGRQNEGVDYGNRALVLANQLGDTHLQAMANRVVGNLLVRGNALPRGVPLLERALTLALDADDPAEAAECCACLTMAYFWSGRMRQMRECLQRRMELAHRCHEPYQLRHLYPWLAACASCSGHLAEAEQWLAQAETAIASLTSPEPRAFLLQMYGIHALLQRSYALAETHLAQAVALFRQMGPGALVWYLPLLGWSQSLLGKREQALACLHETEALLTAHEPESILTGSVVVYLAQMALVLEDRERIARYTARLLPFQGLFLDGLVDRILGELFTFQAGWADARVCLSHAETTARREGLSSELALTLVAQGQLSLAHGGRGSASQAKSLFEQALALCQEMGLQGQASAIRTQLEQTRARSSSRNVCSLPAGLSAREVEVLRLVTEGKSNRQIAEELVLSEKTVANHLARIFAKTGADNRAAAVAFAIRSGIA